MTAETHTLAQNRVFEKLCAKNQTYSLGHGPHQTPRKKTRKCIKLQLHYIRKHILLSNHIYFLQVESGSKEVANLIIYASFLLHLFSGLPAG
jgi:hypothetical protein